MNTSFKTVNIRKISRNTTYRRRDMEALSSNEQVTLKAIKRNVLFCMIKSKIGQDSDIKDKWEKIGKTIVARYLAILINPNEKLPTIPSRKRDFDSFPEDVYGICFRFRRDELQRLFELLRIPEKFTLSNNSTMKEEEVMLSGLYELVSGDNQFKISMLFYT